MPTPGDDGVLVRADSALGRAVARWRDVFVTCNVPITEALPGFYCVPSWTLAFLASEQQAELAEMERCLRAVLAQRADDLERSLAAPLSLVSYKRVHQMVDIDRALLSRGAGSFSAAAASHELDGAAHAADEPAGEIFVLDPVTLFGGGDGGGNDGDAG